LLFAVFIAEEPASDRYDVERGSSATIAFFITMGYTYQRDSQNKAIFVDECFCFSLLSFLISVS
jgi:hypothetical protein